MSQQPKRVLVLDLHLDRGKVRAVLVGSGYDVVMAGTLNEVQAILAGRYEPDLLVLGDCGEPIREAVTAARVVAPLLPIAVLHDEVEAPVRPDVALLAVPRGSVGDGLDHALFALLNNPPATAPDFVVGSPAMRAVRTLIAQVAGTDVPVLITGESGVGKEVVARTVHRDSDRAQGAFIKVNCAALPDQLLESELFGYERGAFTGAEGDKPGKFELADEGTIFLDEIGELPEATQAKLLQVLQDGKYYRLGGRTEVSVDARVIASTNVDIEAAIAAGRFRKDLFYRLNVLQVEVPPLRERREEIPLLVEHFRHRYEREYAREVGAPSADQLARLTHHDWPGNVRELENAVRRMVVLQDIASVVDGLTHSVPEAGTAAAITLIGPDDAIPPLKDVSRQAAMEVEGILIRRALERTQWNRREAAELLQISYKALLYKIRDCGIEAA